jgi:EF hand
MTSPNVTGLPHCRDTVAAFNRSPWLTAGHPGLADQQEETTMRNHVLALGVAGGILTAAGLIGSLITASILPAAAQEMDFMKVDANADGAVTPEEATAAGWAWTQEQFAAADKDSNGTLSADEFVSATGS